jgi:hypothetical protein
VEKCDANSQERARRYPSPRDKVRTRTSTDQGAPPISSHFHRRAQEIQPPWRPTLTNKLECDVAHKCRKGSSFVEKCVAILAYHEQGRLVVHQTTSTSVQTMRYFHECKTRLAIDCGRNGRVPSLDCPGSCCGAHTYSGGQFDSSFRQGLGRSADAKEI